MGAAGGEGLGRTDKFSRWRQRRPPLTHCYPKTHLVCRPICALLPCTGDLHAAKNCSVERKCALQDNAPVSIPTSAERLPEPAAVRGVACLPGPATWSAPEGRVPFLAVRDTGPLSVSRRWGCLAGLGADGPVSLQPPPRDGRWPCESTAYDARGTRMISRRLHRELWEHRILFCFRAEVSSPGEHSRFSLGSGPCLCWGGAAPTMECVLLL